MKKSIFITLLLCMAMSFANVAAETVPVMKGRQQVGTLQYSYKIHTHEDSSGCSVEVTIYNNSDEFVSGWIEPVGTSSPCGTTIDLMPDQKKTFYTGCDGVPREVKVKYVTVK